jgi:DNA-binding MarR family transcriptional regulator
MTPRQGQFLAFIHLYQKLHRQPPAEHELCTYFRLTPPSVHDAIVRMEKANLIARTPLRTSPRWKTNELVWADR